MWAELGYICPMHARYLDTSSKGPGVVNRGGAAKDGGLERSMTVRTAEQIEATELQVAGTLGI